MKKLLFPLVLLAAVMIQACQHSLPLTGHEITPSGGVKIPYIAAINGTKLSEPFPLYSKNFLSSIEFPAATVDTSATFVVTMGLYTNNSGGGRIYMGCNSVLTGEYVDLYSSAVDITISYILPGATPQVVKKLRFRDVQQGLLAAMQFEVELPTVVSGTSVTLELKVSADYGKIGTNRFSPYTGSAWHTSESGSTIAIGTNNPSDLMTGFIHQVTLIVNGTRRPGRSK